MIRVRVTASFLQGQKLLKQFPVLFPRAIQVATLQEAHSIRNNMIGRINAGVPPAHAALTLIIRAGRGGGSGTKTLIEGGGLRSSISVVPFGGGVFVGVRRGRSSRGKDVVNIAQIHEGGAQFTQVMTDRQRRFIFAMLKKAGKLGQTSATASAGGASVRVRIPARPFIGPVIADVIPVLRARLQWRVSILMRGAIGNMRKPAGK